MVTQYVCDKGHIFTHPAKLTGIAPIVNNTTNYGTSGDVLESSVCPDCRSIHFTEVTEDKPQLKDVEAMIDIDAPIGDKVNTAIKDGYVILESWQKNVRLVKYKTAPAETVAQASEATQTVADETMKQAEAAYKKLDAMIP